VKLKDYKNEFYELSGKASDFNRQIAFAGIAIIWLFKITTSNSTIIPKELILPVKLFVLALSLDLIHYVCSSTIWGFYFLIMERRQFREEDEVTHSGLLAIPIWLLYYSKIIVVLVAYYLLFIYVQRNCFN
jgi:hypothetical protein